MKRFTQVALVLGIIMMCASPIEVWGQNRRTGNSSESKTEQRSSNSSSRSSSQRSASVKKSDDNQMKAAPQTRNSSESRRVTSPSRSSSTPARQVQDYRKSTTSRTSRSVSTAPSRNADRSGVSTAPSRNADRRGVSTAPSRSTDRNVSTAPSRSANRTGVNSGRPNNSSDRNAVTPSRSAGNNRTDRPDANTSSSRRPANVPNKDVSHRPSNDGRPNALQYHNSAPAPRENWKRPYLQDHHKPAPPHRYGDHNFGYRCNYLPHGARMRMYNNIRYYYYDGIYYLPYYMGGYVVCRPPIGTYYSNTMLNIALTAAVINAYNDAARRAEQAVAIARAYSDYDNRYQVRNIDDYVTNIASQNDQYYYQDGVFYTLRNGQYYVIEPPVGALITQLPEDYEEIELNGDTYYQVENALYKVTVIDGALYFEVVCAL